MFRRVGFVLALSLIAALAAPAEAKKESDPKKIREGALDEIDLQVDAPPARGPVVIRRFDSAKADPGSAKDSDNQPRKDAVRYIRSEGPKILSETLVSDLSGGTPFPSVTESDQPAPEGALVIEGEFEKIDPGSRAKRYWAGFGAGKSGVTVTGRVTDAQGKVLASFRHTKNSGFGMAGGEYVKFLTDDTRDVAHDVAAFMKRWVAGGDLSKEAD